MRSMLFSIGLLILILLTLGFCLWQTPLKIQPIYTGIQSLSPKDTALLQAQSQDLLRQWEEILPLLSLWIPEKHTEPITEELIRLCSHADTGNTEGIAQSCALILRRLELLK